MLHEVVTDKQQLSCGEVKVQKAGAGRFMVRETIPE